MNIMHPDIRFILKVAGNFFIEKQYIASVFFGEIMGMDVSVEIDTGLSDHYELCFAGRVIVFPDTFFIRTNEEKGYLSDSFLPGEAELIVNAFLSEPDIPLIYGEDRIMVEEERIEIGYDLFATVFFMLTRWEEVVQRERDYLGRFPGKASYAYRHKFLHRPIVNEIAAMVKKMISKLLPGFRLQNPQPYAITFTHDIDYLNAPVSLREFARDVLKRKSSRAFFKRLDYLVRKKNPYDLFDFFMDISERSGSVSHFYFMTGHNIPGKDGQNYNVTANYSRVLDRIKSRGHLIGFHPSLLSYNDEKMFAGEKKLLERDAGQPVYIGRQHALRFNCPDTWIMWERNQMKIDSTLGYSDHEGFRCGTGCTYTIFDVVRRKQLQLKEMPLVLMDTTIHVNRKLPLKEAGQVVQNYIDTAKRMDMPITLLFHNLIDDSIDWPGWKELYQQLFGGIS